MLIALICAFSLLAGFIDSVVGGGGLIQLPAMLILFPNLPIATILGTNKFASCAGTTIAVRRYAQHVTFDWPTILPAAITAFIFSFLGSRTVALLNTAFLRPIVLGLLIVVAIYVFFVKDLGSFISRSTGRKRRSGSAFSSALPSVFMTGFLGRAPEVFLSFFSSACSVSIFWPRRPRRK